MRHILYTNVRRDYDALGPFVYILMVWCSTFPLSFLTFKCEPPRPVSIWACSFEDITHMALYLVAWVHGTALRTTRPSVSCLSDLWDALPIAKPLNINDSEISAIVPTEGIPEVWLTSAPSIPFGKAGRD